VKVIWTWALVALIGSSAALVAQAPPRPRPFPGTAPPPASDAIAPQPSAQAGSTDPASGVPLYPGAQLLDTFNASPNQRFSVYGTSAAYPTVVEYYRTVLKDRGRQLFDGPMHQFDLGRFRRETMTLQPAVTVKDFTWNGRDGYVHVSGRQIVKYPTIIQIVPMP
jgi:hypothetical protein